MSNPKGMGKMDIHKYGKKFSKDYQPPNENKRVPKWRYQMKKMFLEQFKEMYGQCVERIKETGDFSLLDKMIDRLYGKVTDEHNITIKDYSSKAEEIRELIKNE